MYLIGLMIKLNRFLLSGGVVSGDMNARQLVMIAERTILP